ncbi:MAG: hypothetical protein Ct9H300mP11_10670 [Chloroflexota bacterium]|nr:MAG: hypothetical protein Ct9H300mP11_10670 [Chloroflexota bacterium]
MLAKEIATLDRYSGGRFQLGIGTGWLKEETELMGGDFEHRWTKTREGPRGHEGTLDQRGSPVPRPYFDFPLVKSYPNQPRLPIHLLS